MRHTRHRAALSLAAAAALALGLAGCAPGASAGDDGDAGAQLVSGMDPSSFKGQKLDYVYFTDGPDLDVTKTLIAEFEKKYDVQVTLEVVPYSDLNTTLQTRLAGGKAPDVARVAALTPFDGDLLNLKPYLGDDVAKTFIPALRGPITDADGGVIAAPSDLTMNGILLNTDLFAKAGVALPSSDKPWTWTEMVAAAEKVKAKTGTEYAFAIDKSGHRLSTVLAQNDAFLLDGKKAALDPAKATEALTPLAEMMKKEDSPKDLWLDSGSKYAGANDVFLAQQTPVYLSGNWQVAQFAKNASFGWAAAPNACMAECGGFPGGKFTVAFKESKVKPLAALLVQFLTSKENQERFDAATNLLPTRADLAANGVKYETRQKDMDVFLADLNRTGEKSFSSTYSPYFDAAAQAFVKRFATVAAEQSTLPDAMKGLSDDVKQIVSEG